MQYLSEPVDGTLGHRRTLQIFKLSLIYFFLMYCKRLLGPCEVKLQSIFKYSQDHNIDFGTFDVMELPFRM